LHAFPPSPLANILYIPATYCSFVGSKKARLDPGTKGYNGGTTHHPNSWKDEIMEETEN